MYDSYFLSGHTRVFEKEKLNSTELVLLWPAGVVPRVFFELERGNVGTFVRVVLYDTFVRKYFRTFVEFTSESTVLYVCTFVRKYFRKYFVPSYSCVVYTVHVRVVVCWVLPSKVSYSIFVRKYSTFVRKYTTFESTFVLSYESTFVRRYCTVYSCTHTVRVLYVLARRARCEPNCPCRWIRLRCRGRGHALRHREEQKLLETTHHGPHLRRARLRPREPHCRRAHLVRAENRTWLWKLPRGRGSANPLHGVRHGMRLPRRPGSVCSRRSHRPQRSHRGVAYCVRGLSAEKFARTTLYTYTYVYSCTRTVRVPRCSNCCFARMDRYVRVRIHVQLVYFYYTTLYNCSVFLWRYL